MMERICDFQDIDDIISNRSRMKDSKMENIKYYIKRNIIGNVCFMIL